MILLFKLVIWLAGVAGFEPTPVVLGTNMLPLTPNSYYLSGHSDSNWDCYCIRVVSYNHLDDNPIIYGKHWRTQNPIFVNKEVAVSFPSCDGGARTHEAKKRDLMRVLRYQLRSHRNFKKCWDAPIILSAEFLEVAFIVIQHFKFTGNKNLAFSN